MTKKKITIQLELCKYRPKKFMKISTNSEQNSRPADSNFSSKYEDENSIGQALIRGYFRSVECLTRKIPQSELRTALEIGCAEGYSTERIRDFLGASTLLEASDFLEEQLPSARARVPGVRFIQEDVFHLQRSDSSLDLIYLLQVLEHLDRPDLALKEIHRVTRKYLIIGVPREPIWRILNVTRLKYLREFGNTPGHIQHWSARRFIDCVESHFGPVLAVETPLPWTILLAEKK